ncbi:hypothetical protein J6590_057156 [Homalodisca vitripennis]|nr:hypothetical protein J6590_057156 [Homalodisca vitripennis]
MKVSNKELVTSEALNKVTVGHYLLARKRQLKEINEEHGVSNLSERFVMKPPGPCGKRHREGGGERGCVMERALGRRNRAEILGCVPSLQALEMGKNSLRPYGRHYSNDLTSI